MKKLSVSLAFFIFTAVIGLGWGLDNLYYELLGDTEREPDELVDYRRMGKALAKTLDEQSNVKKFADDWQLQNDIDLVLQGIDKVQLPTELIQTFTVESPLILESEQDYFLHFLLPKQQLIMMMTVDKKLKNGTKSNLALMFTSLFYLGVLSVIAIWLYPLIKNLKRLANAARAVGEGKLDKRIDIKSTSYISDIEIEFNRMAQRIETLVEDNKLLGNAVSHDLRTPIARLRFGIEALQETDNESLKNKYMARLSQDVEEMEQLVSLLLTYARLDQSSINVEQGELDLSSLLLFCIESHQQMPKSISYDITREVSLSADLNYIRMLINNLIGNAIKYGNQEVFISLTQNTDKVVLCVEDDGPGIPIEKRQALLKPFTRGDEQGNSGFGMGLAIASRIVGWHRGDLSIGTSERLGGAKIEVQFCRP